MNTPHQISIIKWQAVALLGVTFSLFCCVFAFINGQQIAVFFLAPFVVLSMYALLAYGPLEVTVEKVSMRIPFGKVGIATFEIEKVEFGSSHLVFSGNNKRLVVPAPAFWSNPSKVEAMKTIEAIAQASGISPNRSVLADYMFTKNAWL